MKSIRLEVVV